MNADELMTRNATTCSKDDLLGQSARVMWETDVGCLVVTDAGQHLIEAAE